VPPHREKAEAAVDTDPIYREQGEALIRERLKDPDSARFTQEVVHHGPDGSPTALCGQINGKNSFGGYSGPHLFAVDVVAKKTALMDGDGDRLLREADFLVSVCRAEKKQEN
jgi:hypothetical protein